MTPDDLERLAELIADKIKPPPEWMTTEQASAYLGCSTQYLTIGRSTGSVAIPFSRVGRLVRYHKPRLDEYLASAEVVNTAKP